MNLVQALEAVDTPVALRGSSDAGLAKQVNESKDSLGGFAPTPLLEAPVSVRLADVLLRLAQAMRPLYTADVYDMHTHWALLRYLGVFGSHGGSPGQPVFLSDAGRRVVGNQRRVMSEELGVGFAVLLSERWMRGRVPGSPTFRTVDIDVALANRSIKAARARKSVEAVGAHRPDYILIGDHPSSRGRMRVAMLECKGTKSPRHSLTQLVRASHQLRGVAIAGRRPAGLAVSTIIGDSHITFNALQLLPDDDKPHSGPWAAGAPPTHADSDVEVVDVDVDRLGPDSPDTTIEPIAARGVEMAAIGLKSSFAFLADFSGDDEAFRRWAPGLVRAKLGRGAEDRRNRTEVTTADGTRYIGVRNRISLPGGDIHAFMGVRQDLDRALHSGDPSAVLDVQRSVHSTDMSPRREGVTESVEAIGTDGAALILTPV